MDDSSGRSAFDTTRWTLVLRAKGDDDEGKAALDSLCQRYWLPLYGCLRRKGCTATDAEDLVQDFFAKVLGRRLFDQADPNRGRLRTFLLTALENHARDAHAKKMSLKRGGGQRHVALDLSSAEQLYCGGGMGDAVDATPELVFDRQWAASVFAQAVERVRDGYIQADQLAVFEVLHPIVMELPEALTVEEALARLGLQPGAYRIALHRLRKRLGDRLREVVRDTVETDEQVDEELAYLRQVLAASRSSGGTDA